MSDKQDMSLNDQMMGQEERELQRYLQMRDQMQDEIKSVNEQVEQLREVTKRFIAHFEVFKRLSDDAREQIRVEIRGASHEMARLTASEISSLIHEKVDATAKRLNQTVIEAEKGLSRVSKHKNKRFLLIAGLACLLCLSAGFGGGYVYFKKTTYILSEDTLHTFHSGFLLEKSLKDLPKDEREQLLALIVK